jgi:hypothetical protein
LENVGIFRNIFEAKESSNFKLLLKGSRNAGTKYLCSPNKDLILGESLVALFSRASPWQIKYQQ